MKEVELLKWHVDIGADAALEDKPVNRFAAPQNIAAPAEQPEYKRENQEGFSEARAKPGFIQSTDNNNMARANTAVKNDYKIVAPQEAARNSRKIADGCNTLAELEAAVRAFDGCMIKKTANKTVFSDGYAGSKVMLIGEAPGANEDMEGIPFCGASGKLMDEMFSHAGLTRAKNIYISNTIFWRPPGNRKPTPEEVQICRPFVEKHISLINPELLVLVGGTATEALLGTKQGITGLRHKFYDYTNTYLSKTIKATAIFHPSYLLRQPSQKRQTWQDILLIKNYLKGMGVLA